MHSLCSPAISRTPKGFELSPASLKIPLKVLEQETGLRGPVGKLHRGRESRMMQRQEMRVLHWSQCEVAKAWTREVTTGVKREDRDGGWGTSLNNERTEGGRNQMCEVRF